MRNVTVISGGGSGLGEALAGEFRKNHRDIIILGRDENKLIETAGRLSSAGKGGIVIPFRCDVSQQEDIDILCGFIIESNYKVDYLINNAGTGSFGDASGNRSPRVEEIIGSNLTGMILLTSAILGITPQSEQLTIVNIMSTSALIGRASETAYCAAKWGARGFTEALRAEFKNSSRRVVAVYPGGMNTPFWKEAHGKDVSSFMDPAEVAEQIAFSLLHSEKIFVSDITINRP